MVADIPVASAPRDSLLACAGAWARDMSPPERSRLAAAGFVAIGLSLLAPAKAPLVLLGTACVGAAALALATWGVVAQADRRQPSRTFHLLGRGLAGLLAVAIAAATAAFLLAFLGMPWIS